jgi:hypothetical protein
MANLLSIYLGNETKRGCFILYPSPGVVSVVRSEDNFTGRIGGKNYVRNFSWKESKAENTLEAQT